MFLQDIFGQRPGRLVPVRLEDMALALRIKGKKNCFPGLICQIPFPNGLG